VGEIVRIGRQIQIVESVGEALQHCQPVMAEAFSGKQKPSPNFLLVTTNKKETGIFFTDVSSHGFDNLLLHCAMV
jgi:hypothetical protein